MRALLGVNRADAEIFACRRGSSRAILAWFLAARRASAVSADPLCRMERAGSLFSVRPARPQEPHVGVAIRRVPTAGFASLTHK
ncbi:hypothetical protein DIE14_32255 [Burkholderia sp. Bp9017]|nr:hypothetical protein DIE14_32255 [Burkholderia sp. Bp9017]RQZ27905.1 hypothetical protein DIE13_28980 [Burkholderia sp. Bp9016]